MLWVTFRVCAEHLYPLEVSTNQAKGMRPHKPILSPYIQNPSCKQLFGAVAQETWLTTDAPTRLHGKSMLLRFRPLMSLLGQISKDRYKGVDVLSFRVLVAFIDQKKTYDKTGAMFSVLPKTNKALLVVQPALDTWSKVNPLYPFRI